MLSRLLAIQDIRLGRGVRLSFVGHEVINGRPHTYSVILKRQGTSKVSAVIQCDVMRRNYTIPLTARQVLSFIRLHYPRVSADVRIQSEPIRMKVEAAA